VNFGDILDKWDKETAKPYGKKRLKDDRDRAVAESRVTNPDETEVSCAKPVPGSSNSATQPKASKKSVEQSASSKNGEPRANPMDVWLRRYGTEDKDSATYGASRAKNAAGSLKSTGLPGTPRKSGEQSVSSKNNERRANPMDVWLRRYGTEDKDAVLESESAAVSPAERRRQLRAMRSEAVLDLHGLTRDEAWYRLETFFADCVRRNLQKVLIIHGKGTHSEDDPVLAPLVKLFIEQNCHAGESGHSAKEEGGSGSTWVLLK
jgi:DNA-nicking Smr family endonuclease